MKNQVAKARALYEKNRYVEALAIAITIPVIVTLFFLLPSLWFWISFEIFAALAVVIGCGGEWWLHHHPAGNKQREKYEYHKLESRFIGAVVIGVTMELLALGHTIREAVKMEKQVEELRRSNNELEARLRPRTITREQHDKFIKCLDGIPRGNVIVIKTSFGNEVGAYARDIFIMLRDAGYNMGDNDVNFLPISSHDPEEIQLFELKRGVGPAFLIPINHAFHSIGVKTIITFPDVPNAELPFHLTKYEATNVFLILVSERR